MEKNVTFKEKISHDNSFKTKSIEMFYFSLEIVQEYQDFTSSFAVINLFLFLSESNKRFQLTLMRPRVTKSVYNWRNPIEDTN